MISPVLGIVTFHSKLHLRFLSGRTPQGGEIKIPLVNGCKEYNGTCTASRGVVTLQCVQ